MGRELNMKYRINLLEIIIVICTITYILVLFNYCNSITKAAPARENLTEMEYIKLENSAYKRQLFQIEADQLVDSICKAHKFDKCQIDFQTKTVTKK